MAEAKKEEAKKEVKHYRSLTHAGLGVVVDGEIVVRFQPFVHKWAGENVKVGYLATDDPAIQERLDADSNVEAIDAKEYKTFTDKALKLATLPLN